LAALRGQGIEGKGADAAAGHRFSQRELLLIGPGIRV
jgi:hypothetical protein